MIRNFFSTPNVIGRLVIVLLFAGGVVFAGAFDGFVVETQASSCCGGSTDASIFSSSGNNGGGGDGDGDGDGDDEPAGCTCIDTNGDDIECSYCDSAPENGCGLNSCHSDCPTTDCANDCTLDCQNAGNACGEPTEDGQCANSSG